MAGAPDYVPPPPAEQMKDMKNLMDRFQKEAGRARAGVVPIAIAFPEIGPAIFLAAELTPEAQAPSIDLEYHRVNRSADEKGGR